MAFGRTGRALGNVFSVDEAPRVGLDPLRQFGNGHPVRDPIAKKIDSFVDGRVHRKAMNLKEHSAGDPCNTLVAVNERLILSERLHQCSGFQEHRRVRVVSERRLLRATDSGSQAFGIPQDRFTDGFCVERLDIVFGKVLQLRVGERAEQRLILAGN